MRDQLWWVRIVNVGMPNIILDDEFFGVTTGFDRMLRFISEWTEKNSFNFVKISLV